MKKSPPPIVETAPPRNSFGPREFLAALDILSRRRAAQVRRLSSVSKLRGAA